MLWNSLIRVVALIGIVGWFVPSTWAAVSWTQQFGTTAADNAYAVTTDSTGAVYVAGGTAGSLAASNATAARDFFLSKYTANGSLLWTWQYGSTPSPDDGSFAGDDYLLSIAVDSNDNVYVGGLSDSSFPDYSNSGGGYIGYVAKFDPNGNQLWHRYVRNGPNNDGEDVRIESIAVNRNDQSVIVAGTVYFGGSIMSDIFLRKYTTDGAVSWGATFGSVSNDQTIAQDYNARVAVDATGAMYVAGSTYGSVAATNGGCRDVVVRKYAANGTLLWQSQKGSEWGACDDSFAIAVSSNGGRVFVAGTSTEAGSPHAALLYAFNGSDGAHLSSNYYLYSESINNVAQMFHSQDCSWICNFYTPDQAKDTNFNSVVIDSAGCPVLAGVVVTYNRPFIYRACAAPNAYYKEIYAGNARAQAVAADASGDLVVGGDIAASTMIYTDVFVRKYSFASTTTQITSVSPAYVGYPYSVYWSVSSSTAGTLTGGVLIEDGSGASCSASVEAGWCTLTSTSVGSKTLRAYYFGDGEYAGSQSSVVLTVNGVEGGLPTTTTVGTISPEPTQVNQSYAVAYSVTSAIGTPTGLVTVTDGSGASCSATVVAGTCSITSTTSGTKTITASYGGSATYATSAGTKSHLVNDIPKSASTTGITSITPASVVDGTPYTVSFVVSPSTATGTVQVNDGTGATCSASAPTGSCQLTSTTAGTKTITVIYGGDGSYNSSQAAVTYVVVPQVTIPNPPSNVNAILRTTTIQQGKKTTTVYSATITWTDNSNNESGFIIRRYKRNPRGACQLESNYSASVFANTIFLDQTAQSTTCGYGVAATNSAGTSVFVDDMNLTN